LKRLYEQSNFAKKYKLDSVILVIIVFLQMILVNLKKNNIPVHEFYSATTNLWDQLSTMESIELKIVKAYTLWWVWGTSWKYLHHTRLNLIRMQEKKKNSLESSICFCCSFSQRKISWKGWDWYWWMYILQW
jgi:hypothetical protein